MGNRQRSRFKQNIMHNINDIDFWQSQREAIYKYYWEDGLSIAAVGRLYDRRSSKDFRRIMLNLGIPTKKIGSDDRPNSRYVVNSHFFDDIQTEAQAYVLGFILSDGHVSSRDHILFTIHQDDVDVLEKIRNVMDSNHHIKKTREKYVTLDISSKMLSDKLRMFGVDNKKTFSLDIRKVIKMVPDYLYRHLIRGMFDGDGSIRYYKYEYFNKHTYHLGFTGLRNVCEFVNSSFC